MRVGPDFAEKLPQLLAAAGVTLRQQRWYSFKPMIRDQCFTYHTCEFVCTRGREFAEIRLSQAAHLEESDFKVDVHTEGWRAWARSRRLRRELILLVADAAPRSECALVRSAFGNPLRPVVFDPRWRTTDAMALARGIYDDRAFDRLPLLADALMDAGCADEQIFDHCRSQGPHVRGCWVVDLVLGKS